MPLTADAVNAALQPPDREGLRQRAAALRNPLIRAAGFDSDAPLTPGSAAVLAVLANPTLRIERNRTTLADAQLLQASVLPNPTVGFNLDVPVGANTGGEVTGYGLTLEFEITALIARGAKIEAARAAGDHVRLDLAWKEWQVAQAARQAVYDVIALRLKEADAESLLNHLNRIASQADVALRQHDLKINDAAAVQAAAGEARVALAAIRRDRADAELSLRQAAGLPPDAALSLRPDVALPNALPVINGDGLSSNLDNRRIDLVALRRGYDSQESSLRAAVLNQFPRISLGLAHGRDTGDFFTLGPSISMDLPFFDRNQANIAIERATRQQLFDEYVARLFEARADVARSVTMIRSLNEVIEAQRAQVVSLSDLVAANEKALSQGNLDIATFYTAAVNLSQKQADLTTLRQDLVHAWISLELAAGARIDGLDGPSTAPSTVPAKEIR
jgi:cobalt-zinc-cadmium efflux system outer membrane protein